MELRVLVIDDSAYTRAALRGILESLPGIKAEVLTAVDGLDGYRQTLRFPPDLIMLDLEMPEMDGFTFLRLIRDSKVPVIVISGKKFEESAPRALRLGASDYIEKPTPHTSDKLFSIKGEISRKVRSIPFDFPRPEKSGLIRNIRFGSPEAVVIGASTGGPRAVNTVVKMLPERVATAFVVSIHMPWWLTEPFVERLDSEAHLPVRVARDGCPVKKGEVIVTPGGYHISFYKKGGTVFSSLTPASSGDLCTPSIDRMFTSASTVWGAGVVGVIMTGMGADGSKGAVNIKENGGVVLAESKESSAVFSMPEAAISTGSVEQVLSSSEIGEWIIEKCGMASLKLA